MLILESDSCAAAGLSWLLLLLMNNNPATGVWGGAGLELGLGYQFICFLIAA